MICRCVNCFVTYSFSFHLDQSDELADTNSLAGRVDNVPVLTNSREQLPNVPVYTATDYECTLKYKNTISSFSSMYSVVLWFACIKSCTGRAAKVVQ